MLTLAVSLNLFRGPPSSGKVDMQYCMKGPLYSSKILRAIQNTKTSHYSVDSCGLTLTFFSLAKKPNQMVEGG